MNNQNLKIIERYKFFLGFANFYRRFILRYSKVIKSLTNLLKGMVKDRKSGFFCFTKKARTTFREQKERFKSAPILRLYNSKLPIRFKTDISRFAVKIVISQLFSTEDNKKIK
jgi:hypothetical protein